MAELSRFLHIAVGSAGELEYYLILAKDLKFLPIQQFTLLTEGNNQVKRMLATYLPKMLTSDI